MTNTSTTSKQVIASNLAKLSKEAVKIQNSKDWKDFLAINANLAKYSFRNKMLIRYQFPNATKVASYTLWKKVGRTVKKGEKGIPIFLPCIRKIENTDTADTNSTDSDTAKFASYFKVGYVFDLSQTEGKELKTYASYLEDDVDNFHRVKFGILHTIPGYSFDYRDAESINNRKGYVDESTKKIVVQDGMSEAQQIATISHEVANALFSDCRERDKLELVAEGVSYCVCKALGIESTLESAQNLASITTKPDEIKILADAVSGIVKSVMENVNKALGISEYV